MNLIFFFFEKFEILGYIIFILSYNYFGLIIFGIFFDNERVGMI